MSPVSPCHMGIACRSINTSHQPFHQGTDDCTICVPATDMQVVDPSPQPSHPPYSSMHYCRAWQWPPRRTAASQPCGQAQSSSSRYATVFVLQEGARLDAFSTLQSTAQCYPITQCIPICCALSHNTASFLPCRSADLLCPVSVVASGTLLPSLIAGGLCAWARIQQARGV